MQKPPRIAVLGGTGNEGRGLAQRFAHAGLPVVVGSRDPARAKDVVESWGTRGHGITVADNGTAIAEADITVVSVPFHSIAGLLQEHQRRFRAGALVIDV